MDTIKDCQCDIPFDTDNEDQLVLSRDVEGTVLLGKALQTDLLTLLVAVLLDVLLGTLEDDFTLFLLSLWSMLAMLFEPPTKHTARHCV